MEKSYIKWVDENYLKEISILDNRASELSYYNYIPYFNVKIKDNKNYILGDRMINTLDAYLFYKKISINNDTLELNNEQIYDIVFLHKVFFLC